MTNYGKINIFPLDHYYTVILTPLNISDIDLHWLYI